MVPSERLIVPRSLALAPVPALGLPLVVSGGHAVAHPPEQVDFVLVSGTQRYNERPEPSVKKLAPWLVRTSTVIADEPSPDGADAGAAAALPDPDPEPEPPEPHAAAKMPTAASGTPNLTASGIFLSEGKLLICCAFLSAKSRLLRDDSCNRSVRGRGAGPFIKFVMSNVTR